MQGNQCFNAGMLLWIKRVRRTTLISLGCGAFLLGLALPKTGLLLLGVGWLAAGLLLLGCIGRRLLIAPLAIVVCGLILGAWRGSEMVQELTRYQQLIGRKVTFTAVIAQDPTFNTKHQLDFYATSLSYNWHEMPGQIRVTSLSPVEPRRGDLIQVSGKLYDGFGPYQAAIYFGEVTVLKNNTSWLEYIRRSFTATVLSNVPEPQANLGLGFLIGLKSQLTDNLNQQLQRLNLTHIVVASGFNVTVLISVARRLFARRSKYQATVIMVLLMSGFLLVTGLSASMVRAVLVSSLSLAAWYYGRRLRPLLILLLSAAITSGWYPVYLWSDLGWWLSFLSFAGVLMGAPIVQKRFFEGREMSELTQIIVETTCAQLMALPLLLYTFGSISLLALLANVLVVPFIPLAMLLVLIVGITGWIIPVAASWVALPVVWLLTYIIWIINQLAGISWASIPISIDAATMIGLYGVLVGCYLLAAGHTSTSIEEFSG